MKKEDIQSAKKKAIGNKLVKKIIVQSRTKWAYNWHRGRTF